MICEKCGKKINVKSGKCDGCGYPAVFEQGSRFSLNYTHRSNPGAGAVVAPSNITNPVIVHSGVKKGVFAGALAGAICVSLALGWLGNSLFSSPGKSDKSSVLVENPLDLNNDGIQLGKIDMNQKGLEDFEILADSKDGYYLLAKADDEKPVIGIFRVGDEKGIGSWCADPQSEWSFFDDIAEEESGVAATNDNVSGNTNPGSNKKKNTDVQDSETYISNEEPNDNGNSSEESADTSSGESLSDKKGTDAEKNKAQKFIDSIKDNCLYLGEGVFGISFAGYESYSVEGWTKFDSDFYVVFANDEKTYEQFPIEAGYIISDFSDGYMLVCKEDENTVLCYSFDLKGTRSKVKKLNEVPEIDKQKDGKYLLINDELLDISTFEKPEFLDVKMYKTEDGGLIVEYSPQASEEDTEEASKDSGAQSDIQDDKKDGAE